GDPTDPTETITAQIERFAPGFRDLVVASRAIPAAEMAQHNPSLVGGDFAQGRVTMYDMIARPTSRLDPYRLGDCGWYLCSGATPPGPGVHGISGWHAARRVLRTRFGATAMPSLSPRSCPLAGAKAGSASQSPQPAPRRHGCCAPGSEPPPCPPCPLGPDPAQGPKRAVGARDASRARGASRAKGTRRAGGASGPAALPAVTTRRFAPSRRATTDISHRDGHNCRCDRSGWNMIRREQRSAPRSAPGSDLLGR